MRARARSSTGHWSTRRSDGRPDAAGHEWERLSLSAPPDDEVTVVFFGYTHCPDLCPTTMADLAAARRQLPPEVRDRVTVVFVTEDRTRDTPEVLRDWLDGMDPQFVGLLGGNAETKRALQELTCRRREPSRPPSSL